MHFDQLDEIYAMVKSNLQFYNVIKTGMTGLHDRSVRFAQIVQQTLTCANFGYQHTVMGVTCKFRNKTLFKRKGEIHLCSISLSQSILVLILTSAIASTTGVTFGIKFRFILSRCNSWMIAYSMNFELVNWWGWMCCNAPVTILDIPVIPSPHWLDPHWGCVDAERTASGLFEQGTWW
jgi:hypothetical protein